MKSRIIITLLAFLLIISITGCSGNKSISTLNNNISKNDNKISDASNPTASTNAFSISKSENTKTQLTSDKNSVWESYKAVLQNKAEFFSTDNKKNIYLNDFLTNKEIYGTVFKVTHFAVLDMDGDKVPEIVLELTTDNNPDNNPNNNPEFYEVLHFMNGTVYGYIIVYRGLEVLKADGTFSYSSGVADNGCGKIIFESNAYKIDALGYSKSSQGNPNLNVSYFINNKPVTKETFDSFMNEQDRKKDAAWYEFSQKNIDTELSIKP